MDPLTAVGLAGNLIQFVEFGSKLVVGGLDLYKSQDGALPANSELQLITEDLTGICATLMRPRNLMEERQMPEAELGLQKLSRSCVKLENEFLSVLESLKVKGRKRKWENVHQALSTTWRVKDVERYRIRLESYRSQIACHLLSILRYFSRYSLPAPF